MSSAEKAQKRVSRRRFVSQAAAGTAAAVGAGLLAGCSQTPQIVKETVEVPVEVIKEVTVAPAQGPAASSELLTVLNPLGQPPGAELKPLAPRFDTLDGKTVYIVDVKYPSTKPFVNELEAALKAKHPQTDWIVREKRGNYFDDDPDLWAEIKDKGAGAIILVGH